MFFSSKSQKAFSLPNAPDAQRFPDRADSRSADWSVPASGDSETETPGSVLHDRENANPAPNKYQ